MADFLSPGSQVTQKRKGAVVFSAIATAIGGFLVFTSRGPVGKPVQIVSKDDGIEVFGPRITNPGNGRMEDSLIDFYANGGATCYIVRYIGVGSAVAARVAQTIGAPSSGAETSSPGSFPVALSPGDTFIGSVNGGGALTATVNATRASKTGAGATYAAVGGSPTLVVQINGIPGNQTITFAGTENSEALYLQAINSQLRGGSAVDASGQTKIQTDVFGSSAGGQIVSGTAGLLTALGLTVGAFTNAGPNSCATIDAVTATELAAVFNTAFVGSVSTPNTNNSMTWASSTTGGTSSVQLTGGTAVTPTMKVVGFDTALHSGAANLPVNSVQLQASMGTDLSPGSLANSDTTQFFQVNSNATTVNATIAGSTTTLVVANARRFQIGDQISITKAAITYRSFIQAINGNTLTLTSAIVVPVGGFAGTENVVLETFDLIVYDNTGAIVFPSPYRQMRIHPLAGARYFVNVINARARTRVFATDLNALGSVVAGADPRPSADANPVALAGGLDGAAPTANDVINQIAAFNKAKDINQLSCPGCATDYGNPGGVSILQNLETYGENRKDVMIIQDLPQGTAPLGGGGVVDYSQNTVNFASSYEIVLWPWYKRLDAVTGVLTLFPLSAAYQGMVARAHKNTNFGAVAAGDPAGKLANCIDLEFRIDEQSVEYNSIYPAGINAVIAFPGEGFLVYGMRTMDPTGEFSDINLQWVFNINKRLVKNNTRFTVFADNNASTRGTIVRILTAMFREQRKAGILSGSKDSEAFFIICDETNNTPLVVNSGKIKCQIGLAVQRKAQFLDFTMELDTRAVDAALASSTTSKV